MKSTVKQTLQSLARYAVLLLAAAVLGLLLKTLACWVPARTVQQNIESGAGMYEQFGDYPVVGVYSVDKRPAQLDYFTEYELILGAYNVDSAHPLRSAVENYTQSDSGYDKLSAVLEGTAGEADAPREKYWWGALSILRPLLGIFSYAEAAMLLQAAYFMCFAACCVCIYKALGVVPFAAFAASFILVDGFTAAPLYATAFSMLCAMAGMIAVCRSRDVEKSMCMILFITGICTAYFDWMSSPFAACGLPILAGLARMAHENKLQKLGGGVWLTVRAGLAWGCGWAGMVASKFVINALVMGESLFGYIATAIATDMTPSALTTPFAVTCVKLAGSTLPGRIAITHMLQDIGGDAAFTDLYELVKQTVAQDPMRLILPNLWVLVLAAALVGVYLWVLVWKNKDANARNAALLFLAMALTPFAWAFVMKPHTSAHYWFVYRMLAVSFMGLILSVWYACKGQIHLRSREKRA